MQNDTYKYEAVIGTRINYEIKSVSMLTPILVKVTSQFVGQDKQEIEITGKIDYLNKQVYLDNISADSNQLKEKILEFMNQSVALPDDMYLAPEEVYEEANRAQQEHDAMRAEHT